MQAKLLVIFGPNLWLCDGPAVTGAAGFRFPTRMAVIRLRSGDLWIWSPVTVTDAARAELDALGPVRHIIAPNKLHDTFLADWAAAYPEAAVHAAPGLTEDLTGVGFASILGEEPDAAWAEDLDQALVTGNRIAEEAVFHHRESGAALVTDLVQHIPGDWYSGWRRIVARLDRMSGPAPAMPRKFRLAFRRQASTRAAAERILSWRAERLVIAHGPPLQSGAHAVLEEAFGWLAQ